MSEPTSDTGDEAGEGPGRGTPRWAKVIGIIVGVVVALLAIKILTVGGGFDLGALHRRMAGVHGG